MACASSGNATLNVTQSVKNRKALPEPVVENYFNYFTEVEEHYQRRRGTGLLLSTLDWALIETWKQANIPLEAVLRGIDRAFEKHEARRREVRTLAYCQPAVLEAL